MSTQGRRDRSRRALLDREQMAAPRKGRGPPFFDISTISAWGPGKQRVAMLTRIQIAVQRDWHATAWLLARMYPELYADRMRLEQKAEVTLKVGRERARLRDLTDDQLEAEILKELEQMKRAKLRAAARSDGGAAAAVAGSASGS